MKKRIIAFVLTLATLFSLCAFTANAASGEEFISEVSLVYANSVDSALSKIEGTGWKLFKQDLNADADYMFDNGVYLVYKTSTNVEDAITDLRVMDMYGGFSTSNYQRQLEESREGYMKLVGDLRIVADEFKTAVRVGDDMAELAKDQLAVYKDVKTEGGTETGMSMDEFFMNMPSDEQVVQVLMEGNAIVVSNLITLLAIGISGSDESTLAERIADNNSIKDYLTDELYYDDAVTIYEAFASVRSKLLRYDALSSEYDLSDEEMDEEEFQFMSGYASLAVLLEEIEVIDGATETNLADFLRKGEYAVKDFYPIAAALTDGQLALIRMGQIETILKYGAPSTSCDDLRAFLDEYMANIDEEYKDIFLNGFDVYTGVDRSIFKGTFAMTNEAERQQALTGETWDIGKAAHDSTAILVLTGIVGGLAAVALVSLGGFALSWYAANLVYLVGSHFGYHMIGAWSLYQVGPLMYSSTVAYFSVIAAAVLLVAAGITGITLWYNYYNPDYTEIPNTMIDVRETSLGDKFVKYTAAKVFGDDKKNADFNAYEGKEWIALYYTKDATAGNCLTPNFVFKDNDSTIARRHQGISMFGEDKAFNLNSHVYDDDAKGAYVTVRYSTTKKMAASAPSVVGSMIATGALYAVTAIGGAGVGVGATVLIQRSTKNKKSDENEATEENAAE